MASIEKMLIKGIRSFGPYNEDAITFFKPLTIIVGPNGSGKTTVIECLKQACTGSMPPGVDRSKGAAFVHDPKISGQSETRAQIKLRLVATSGQQVVVVKSFQVNLKGSRTEFRASDQTIKTLNAEGKQEAVSCRVSDIEKMVPSMMGVSKAMIESVIFVHQDESNWPLGEAAAVKKRFDDIFNLGGYIKAMESLKKTRLEHKHELEKAKLKLDHLQTHIDHVEKLTEAVAKDEGAIKQMNTGIAGFDKQMAHLRSEVTLLEDKVKRLNDVRAEVSMAMSKKQMLQETNRKLFDSLESEAEESLDELLVIKQSLDEKLASAKNQLENQTRLVQDVKRERESSESDLRQTMSVQTRLLAEIDISKKEMQSLKHKHKVLSMKHDPDSEFCDFGPNDMLSMCERVQRLAADKQNRLKSLKAAASEDDRERREAVQKVETKLYQIKEHIKMKEELVQSNRERVDEIEKWRSNINIDKDHFESLQNTEQELQEQLKNKLNEREFHSYNTKLSTIAPKIDDLERKRGELSEEKDKIQESSSEFALYREKRKDLDQQRERLDVLLDTYRTKLDAILEAEAIDGGNRILEALNRRKSDLDKRREQNAVECSKNVNELSSVDQQIDEVKKTLCSLEQEAEEVRDNLNNLGLDVPECEISALLQDEEAKLDAVDKKLGSMGALDMVFEQYMNRAREGHACPVCKRVFDGKSEESEFVDNQRANQEKLPERINLAKKAKEEIEAFIEKLTTGRSLYREHREITETKVAEAKTRLGTLQRSKAGSEKAIKVLKEVRQKSEEEAALVQLLFTEVAMPAQQLCTSIESLETDIKALGPMELGSSGNRTLEEVKADLKSTEKELKESLDLKEAWLTHDARLNVEIVKCEKALREHREDISEAEGNAVELKSKTKEMDKLSVDIEEIEGQISQCSAELNQLETSLDGLDKEREEAAKVKSAEIESEEGEVNEYLRDAEQMKQLCEKYQSFDLAEKAEQLSVIEEKLASQKSDLDNVCKTLEKKESEVDSLKKSLAEHNNFARNVGDNIAYKQGLEEQQKAESALHKLQADLESMEDVNEIERELSDYRGKYEEALKKKNYLFGSRKALEQKIKEKQDELGSSKYKNIEKSFEKQAVVVRTTGLAITDITNYTKALDKALVSFHNKKVANINKTIKELWQKTYRNADIDYIQIRTESEGRSRNYRVVMISGGTELDMRGRCSAGQKVLASIIIRLALAETFCIDCGILALDEPTTNLDEENSRSLAIMLQQIIELRSSQQNFQLLVITHDEHFAQMIGKRQYCEKYWYVHKDENQYSKLLMQDVIE